MDPLIARKTFRTLEPLHGFVYFSPDAEPEYVAVGLKPGRMGYFASSVRPMGAVPAEVVIATFFNFHPKLITDRVPKVWSIATPQQLLDARHRAVDAMLRRIIPGAIDTPEMKEAADLARSAVEACTPEGRPLYAGHAALQWPDEPHNVLWHAQTLLREFRGDGHIAAMTAEGLTGCEALVTHAAMGEIAGSVLKGSRRWPDDEWDAAVESLRARGWLDAEGAFTNHGRERRAWIEERTDELAMRPWERIGEDACTRLRTMVRPWSKTIVESGGLG